MTNIISFSKVHKKYPGQKIMAVSNLDFIVNEGEFFCLVGPSGCGKTTILKLIAGIEKPSSGQLIKPENVAMVFQSGALFPWLTVKENVVLGLKMQGLATTNAEQFLEMVGLKNYLHKYPRELSGGQKQRVGIARALVISPQVLLLDEPFSALDTITTEELHKDLLKIWQETKITIMMVSHLLEEAVSLADRVMIIKEGSIVKIEDINIKRPMFYQDRDLQEKVKQLRALF